MTDSDGGDRAATARLRDRDGPDRITLAVVAVVVAASAARFYRLGARTAHFDEGRVAYWVLDYAASGNVRYRPIIHGPFLQHVTEVVFGVLGPTDFSMRLVVAAVTGLFPLAALLLRERLRDVEVVALAALWAFTPVVLYYSRFVRGDPLVAAFAVTAFALFVRTVDTGRRRYFYAGVGFLAGSAAVVADYRRPLVYLLGIPFTLGQVVAWYVVNAPNFSALGFVDKAAQLGLVALLVILYRREA